MDKAMHKMGLHGKSFIPMLMGFGCNVPAVVATRTIESRRDRILTMMVVPFMSCSARLPVYVLFISAFFPLYKSGILFGIYLFGIFAAFITALLLSKTLLKKPDMPFVMELPPYRMPTLKAVSKHMWFKSAFFLKKMGTIILLASIIIWALGYFPRNKEIIANYDTKIEQTYITFDQKASLLTGSEKEALLIQKTDSIENLENEKNTSLLQQSYIARMGKTIEPVFEPLGFDWKMSVSILTGVLAKEIVVSSMSVLYQADEDPESSVSLEKKLQQDREQTGRPLYVYIGFLVFILLYFPCIGTLSAIRKETSNMGWTLFSLSYATIFAWLAAFAIAIMGSLIF
jgi:ferrous iron transport protein B